MEKLKLSDAENAIQLLDCFSMWTSNLRKYYETGDKSLLRISNEKLIEHRKKALAIIQSIKDEQ